MTRKNAQDHAAQAAKVEARMWTNHGYYDEVEDLLEKAWNQTIVNWIGDCDFDVVVDLAAGHGRNSRKLLERAKKLYIVDLVPENIEFCRNRFGDDPRITYINNSGTDLAQIPDSTVSLLYCWDAMVHFDSDIVRNYLGEFSRILKPGGRAFCHHSNWTDNPGGFQAIASNFGPGRRNFMSRSLYAHYAIKEGLRVLRQQVIQWNVPDQDCLSLVERPYPG